MGYEQVDDFTYRVPISNIDCVSREWLDYANWHNCLFNAGCRLTYWDAIIDNLNRQYVYSILPEFRDQFLEAYNKVRPIPSDPEIENDY